MTRARKSRIRELVRHFKENGMKMMLEHPANVRDVLRLADVPWFEEIGFDQLEHIKTTFIRRNYRHLQSDRAVDRLGACATQVVDLQM